MLLGKPFYSCTYTFLCVSLDGCRRVPTGEDDDKLQRGQALDSSMLDHYTSLANWQENNPEILNLTLIQFAYVGFLCQLDGGELKYRRQKIIIRAFPNFSPNPSGKKYWVTTASMFLLNISLNDCHENHIRCYHSFLTSERASQYIPKLINFS